MSADEQTPDERAFTELFQRLPSEPPPLGFRDAVMSRIARRRRHPWEWVAAAAVAIPNLLFLAWQLLEHGEELAVAMTSLTNTLLGVEEWSPTASVYVDGMLLLAVALVGLAGLLVTHVLVAEDRARLRAA